MTMKRRTVLGAFAMLAIAGLGISAAQAQSTLEQVKKNGVLRVGLEFGRPPWGFKDKNLNMTGYDMETARLIAHDLGVKLQIVELTIPNRIPFLTSGKVDAVVSTFSITPARQKVIDFSIPYGSALVSVAAPKSEKISDLADLKGKRVGVTRGSTSDTALTAKAPSSTDIVRFDDESTTMTAFTSGQVEAAVTEPATLKRIAEANPGQHFELKFTLVEFPIGVGLRKGDDALETAINKSIKQNLSNEKLNTLYKTFFGVGLSSKVLAEAK